MSIWSSVAGPEIRALNGAHDEAKYRAEGEPSIQLDVATTGHHDHIRLSLFEGGADVDALLSPDAARSLCDLLDAALGEGEEPRSVNVVIKADPAAIAQEVARVARRHGRGQ
ncbi:hypothetical protein ACN2WE_21420 [Streptomyces sp. cg28]|uniref:hypothetical protein n=1 Tax=Streptomyces sp. cg28 TaxID=3403457 RepID=UPI003B217AB3